MNEGGMGGMHNVESDVMEFRRRWAEEPGMGPVHAPVDLSDGDVRDMIRMYINFEREELNEMEEALDAGDMPGIIDAHCDGLVFKVHALARTGILRDFHLFFSEVSRSNMTKGDGTMLINPETGKMIKGPGFEEPELEALYERVYGRGVEG